MNRSTRLFIAAIVALAPIAACSGTLALENRPCPCAEGWTCCASQNVCVGAGQSCDGVGSANDAGSSGDGGANACTDAEQEQCTATSKICVSHQCIDPVSEDCTELIAAKRPTGNPIIWGVLAPRTGANADVGTQWVDAVRLALEELAGSAAPVPGVIAVVCDDQVDSSRPLAHLVDNLGVRIVIGPGDGVGAEKTVPQLIARDVVTFFPGLDSSLATLPGHRGHVWQLQGQTDAGPPPDSRRDLFEIMFKTRFPELADQNVGGTVMSYYEATYAAFFSLADDTSPQQSPWPPEGPHRLKPATSANVAAGIGMLEGPGKVVVIGLESIATVLSERAAGRSVNLDGLLNSLDWNEDGMLP